MSTQKGKQVDELRKGVVATLGDSVYRIDITYSKESHGPDCGMCKILRNRDTGRDYFGISEMAGALSLILEYYAYDIRNSALYSHAKSIGVEVMRQHGSEWKCDAQYEITKGA
mgnify:CR=1 FL=1